MGTYRKEWPCCDSVTETQGWEPDQCPFCAGEQPADERKDAELERMKDPKYLCHRGNRISLGCGTNAIALFVSRAIASKDQPTPTPEQVAQFRAALDACLAEKGERK